MQKRRAIKKNTLLGYLFLVPAAVFVTLFIVIPVFWNLGLAFFQWDGVSDMKFTGIKNFTDMFQNSAVFATIRRSIFIALVSTAVSMGLGILYALLLNRLKKKEQTVLRFIFFCPAMLPLSIVGILFIFVFSTDVGILNSLLSAVGLEQFRKPWLADPSISLWVIAIVQGWRQAGVIMILITTAIMGIPKSLFENGRLEGCNYWDDVRYVILPLIKPSLNMLLSMTLMSAFKTYDMVYSMTKGGPGEMTYTVPMKIMQAGFSYNRYGQAAALGVVLTVVTTVFIVAARYALRGENYEY